MNRDSGDWAGVEKWSSPCTDGVLWGRADSKGREQELLGAVSDSLEKTDVF